MIVVTPEGVAVLAAAPASGGTDITVAVAVGTAIAGILAPFITSLVLRPSFSEATRRMLGTGIALFLGIVSLAITGGFATASPAEWGVAVLAVAGVSQTLYALILKPTGVAAAVEQATSPTPPSSE